MKVKNNGDVTAYIPNDNGTAITLEPGESSPDLRQGNAEFAVHSIPGVEYDPEPTTAVLHGIAEASTGAAIGPISEYVEAHPNDVRYAAIGDAVATPGDVTVVGSEALSVTGGETVGPVGGFQPTAAPAEGDAPAEAAAPAAEGDTTTASTSRKRS